MAAAVRPGPFSTKSHELLVAETGEKGHTLRRAVGALDLTALGVGAVIGTGIFVIIGEAIGKSGPAIVLSFLLAGVTCVFSALSYAELASTIPVAGSAYTYSYATMGELIAWIIGWDLILEYGISVAAVAVGWGAYLQSLLASLFGIHLSNAIAQPPGEGGSLNLPAAFLVLAVAGLLIAGVRKSTRANTVMVITKIIILIFFVVVAFSAFHSSNLHPFAPHGFGGIRSAAALIFFAYIGFDAVSTAGEECRKPGRDMPIAIVGSLVICTILYILVAIAAAGAYPAAKLAGNAAPLATVLTKGVGISWAGDLLSFGALIAITSVVLTVLYGQTRIMFAMCRDGLLPARFAAVSERTGTPVIVTATFGILIAILAALVPLTTIAELVNIGTLFAFLLVNIGVIWLRYTQPELERPFRVPAVWVVGVIGSALCIYLMAQLPIATWARFFGWMAVGLLVYGFYGYSHSRLRTGDHPSARVPGEASMN